MRNLLTLSLERFRRGAPFAVASVAAALLSLATVALLAHGRPQVAALCITAVIIALSLVRVDEREAGPASAAADALPPWLSWLARLAMVPLVALVGAAIVGLVGASPALGFAGVGVPLVLAIWVRRFGPVWQRLGTLWSFPFIAVLVTPAAAAARGAGVWWAALAALIAVSWASLLGWWVSVRFAQPAGGAVKAPAGRPSGLRPSGDRTRPSAGAGPGAGSGAEARQPAPRRLQASDKMAIHLAISLAAAILLGWWLLPEHLGWLVLTAFIVNSGNRGRGDVVYKGIQRLVGAGLGTVAATLLAAGIAPGRASALIVVFVVLAVGALLRPVSYAWWAAAMTGALALLYGYLGQGGAHLLDERLLAILLGGLIAIAASCFVLPVRSIDAFRRRTADLLGLGREVLAGDRTAPGYAAIGMRVHEATARVAQLAPPFHALRLVTLGRLPAGRRTADLIDRVTALGGGLEHFVAQPSRELGGRLGAELREVRDVLVSLRDDRGDRAGDG